MSRTASSAAVAVLFALVVVASAGARADGGPFYLVPSPTKECQNVKDCLAVTGPWVVIPAHGEATFLVKCPLPRGFVVGGTDSRASSGDVRVWFDGQLGAPIGTPAKQSSIGAGLLFHAVTESGRPGSFQPILGCVTLKQKSPRSILSARAVSAVPSHAPSPPVDLHSRLIPLEPGTYYRARIREVSCLPNEKLIGSWTALTFPQGPPDVLHLGPLTVGRHVEGKHVFALLPTASALFGQGGFPDIQVGAVCQS
jgi:hypothetical protein